jgi:hypothetical protein
MAPTSIPSERGWRQAALRLAPLLAVLLTGAAPGGKPLVVHYEAFALGLPVMRFDFRLDQSGERYEVDGEAQTLGLLRVFYRLDMATESQGTVAADSLRPRFHEHRLTTRGHRRLAHLDYSGDGSVAASLVPAEDSGRPKPTAQQTEHTMDPLSAILAIGRSIARIGNCAGRFAVFDGRRRYDLVLADEGVERVDPSSISAYSGEARRCPVAVVKIAGFSFDQDYSPHTTNGLVWFATLRPDAPALPIRIEFDSNWGFVHLRMTAVDGGK